VSATLQLEEVTQIHDAPRLLVEWSSPWDEFVTSIRPALSRSTARLAGEAPFGLIPYRIMLAACALELFLIFCAIIVPIKLAQLHPYIAPRLATHDIIYYSGDELPRTEDLGGTHAGAGGRAGGTEAHHRTQTVKVARGGSMVEKVLDAPRLKLAPSPGAVANLLAIRPDAGPPPTEGMRSSRAVPNLPSSVIAPVPSLTGDFSRTAVLPGSVIPPAPSVSRDRVLIAPTLNTSVVAPAPTVSSNRTRSTPSLVTNVIPPAPEASRDRTLIAPSLDTHVVAPAPSLSRDAAHDQARSAPALHSSIVPPAPAVASRDVSRSPVQMVNAAVVPPPVSAPERESARNPKLAMPAPSVVAPPPSTDMSQDLHRLASGSAPDLSKSVVPPPPTPAASTSYMSSLLNRVFGSTSVVVPPPTVTGNASSRTAGSLGVNVVPPPPAVSGSSATSTGMRAGASPIALARNVVPPPPAVGASATRSPVAAPADASRVVPPPPAVPGAGPTRENPLSASAGPALTPSVVPPPPTVANGSGALGSGRGASGAGLGAPLDAGSVVARPASGGSGVDASVVISKDPGPKVGLPADARAGSLAMSPSGGDKPGVGGSGGGSGLVRGDGPGSGISSALNGAGAGGGKTGPGHGSDPAAKAGISPTPGPGGAGSATRGTPAVPGVSVAGGSSVVTVDFGSGIGSGDPNLPGRSSVKDQHKLSVSVQSTASSGGAFDFYHLLPAATSHDVYLETSPPAVLRYSEPTPAHGASGDLTMPEEIHTDLPAGLPHSRLVITCVLDASGNLKNLRVLEAGPADMTAKVMAALPSWKFSPVMVGNHPVEVNAILGFNIDTNDRR
jgi:hypothetical protein